MGFLCFYYRPFLLFLFFVVVGVERKNPFIKANPLRPAPKTEEGGVIVVVGGGYCGFKKKLIFYWYCGNL